MNLANRRIGVERHLGKGSVERITFMTDEQAKAVQEVAKSSGKLIETTEKVGGFISKIVGGASNQVGGILEDWAKFYRYKNLLHIADKVEAIHVQRKIEGKTIPIPPRTAIPLIESAALESDEVLQGVWARLIANSTDPNFKQALHPGYIEIIKQLSPDEAVILESFLPNQMYPVLFLYHVSKKYEGSGMGGWMASFDKDVDTYDGIHALYLKHCERLVLKNPANADVYFDNLQRLKVIELGHNFSAEEMDAARWLIMNLHKQSSSDQSVSIPARDEFLRMTAFGQGFVEACIKSCDQNANA